MSTAASDGYAHLDDETIADFENTGCDKLITKLETDDYNVSSTIYTEILMILEDGRLNVDNIIRILEKALKDDSKASEFCQVLDVFVLSEPIKQLISTIFHKNIVKATVLARCIKPETLLAVKIVPDNFNKLLSTRKRDHFYTQKKYNLLHEESEGYAKLIVEVYHVLRGENTAYQLKYTLKIIENLVGHYNLDPNRVLDILVSILSNNFVSNHRFVIELLKSSHWWPKTESDSTTSLSNLSIGGSETGSKIIGLRLLMCRKDRDLPETFKILIGCLIKEGFLSFASIFPYLDTEDMESIEDIYKKDLEERVLKASANALALAAPLLDEDEENGEETKAKPASKVEEVSLQSALLSNLVYQFLRVFLSVGLYYPSLFILTKYPFLAYVDDDIPELINRLFHEMLSPLHKQYAKLPDSILMDLQVPMQSASSTSGHSVLYEDITLTDLFSFKPTLKNHGTKKYTFFYSEWKEGLPYILTIEGLFDMSHEFLKFSGANLSKHSDLFSQICDIAVADYEANELNHPKWFNYFRNFIYPAMSIVEENPFLIEKGFSVMQCFSLEDRYNLYGELHQVLSKSNSSIQIAYGRAEKSTKDILKRLSKENVRPMMRRLAKTSFANPLPCLLTILQQIESYDNLIPLVVDTAKYFNQYGWETLTLAIMMRLTTSGRSSIQQDGLNERQWIQSLAQFVGKICQRYPLLIDLKTLLSFILKTLHQKDMIAVIVLKEMLRSMGGIQSINNLTLAQIDMMNCETSLQKVAYRTVNDTRYDCITSGKELLKVINALNAENECFIQLCQLGHEITNEDDMTHLKILANKNDEMNSVIQLFVQFYNFFGDKESFSGRFFSIEKLCKNYNIEPRLAYRIWDSGSTGGDIPELPNDISSQLYDTFWSLRLYDINYSLELYAEEVTKLEGSIPGLRENILASKSNKDVSSSVTDRYRATLEQNLKFIKSIPVDAKSHAAHKAKIDNMLMEQKEGYFKTGSKDELRSFLQHCVLPRAITSSFDASFAAKILFKLHELEVPKFSIISLLQELIGNRILFGTLFTLSPLEAENLGIFYSAVFKILHDWTDKPLFEQNCTSLKANEAPVTYDDFRTKLFEFHEQVLADVGNSLTVKEYMSRRNAITFLKNLLGVYPNVENHCETMLRLIQNISDHEERQDLKLSSYALIGHLRSRSKEWVHLWDFVPMSNEQRNKLIKEHQEAEEAAKQEKLRLEENARQEKMKLKLEAEKKEREKLNQNISLSYDDSSRPASRADIRKLDTKKRYDYYNKYEGSTAEKKENDEESNEPNRPNKQDEDKAKDVEQKKEVEKEEAKKSDVEAKPDIKQKIAQAKQKLANKPTPQTSNEPTPEPDLFPKGSKKKEDTRDNRLIRRPRAPLPPQEMVASRGPAQDRTRRYNDRSRYTPPTRNHGPIPPPPPPPPPSRPGSSARGDRDDSNKRRRDTYDGRGYEKRQKR